MIATIEPISLPDFKSGLSTSRKFNSNFSLKEAMKLSMIVYVGASALVTSVAQSLVLPKPTQNCSTFAQTISHSFAGQEVTIINSTLVPANSTGSSEFEYCQLYGKIAYAGNNTLNFQVYLPDATAYTGRFMAVGESGPFKGANDG